MQEWDADTFPDSSKGDTIKASSKLFLFHRFRSKKLKNNNKSPKNKHDASTEDSGPELDSPPSPKVCSQPKCSVGSFLYDPNDLLPRDFLSKIILTVFLLSAWLLPSGTQDTVGADGFFDLLSRFQGNRLEDQRCSLLDSPSRLPPPSPSSTPPVAERKCECVPFVLCSHHMLFKQHQRVHNWFYYQLYSGFHGVNATTLSL